MTDGDDPSSRDGNNILGLSCGEARVMHFDVHFAATHETYMYPYKRAKRRM